MTALLSASPLERRPVWSPLPFATATTVFGAGSASMEPVTGPGAMWLTAVTNAASGEAGWIAPGQLVVVHGEGFKPGVRVRFDRAAGHIADLSSSQILVVAPYSIAGRDWVTVTVENPGGERAEPLRAMVVEASPALFTVNGTGVGQAVAENADGTANGPANPAMPGEYLTLFGTGEGLPDCCPASQGERVPVEPWLLPMPKLPVRVFVDNQEAGVVYAGALPGGTFGKLLVVLQVPRTLPAGCWEVTLQVGDFLGRPGVTVRVG